LGGKGTRLLPAKKARSNLIEERKRDQPFQERSHITSRGKGENAPSSITVKGKEPGTNKDRWEERTSPFRQQRGGKDFLGHLTE